MRTTPKGLYTSLLEKLILPLGDRALRTAFVHHLQESRHFDTLTSLELARLQQDRLAQTLRHATRRSPYYRALWSYDERISPQENLSALPVLTKALLRRNTDRIFTMPRHKLTALASSGSSGMRSVVYLAPDELAMTQARQTRWWEWSGYRLGSKILQTGMTPQRGPVKKLKDIFLRTLYVPAFALSREEIAAVLARARRHGIRYLFGYASSLYVFAEVAEQFRTNLRLDAIVSWGDKLFPHYRTKMERAFDARVFETYGCAEGLMIAAQSDLEYLYIMTPNVYLELLDAHGDAVPDGTMGHVVVTSLTARSFPLIRYRLGDLAIRLPQDRYPARRGLNYPLLQKVVGRDTDIVRTPTGKSLVVHSFTGVFEHFSEIRQFCVIQSVIDGIVIQYVPAENFTREVLATIRSRLEEFIQEPFRIEFEEVAVIPPTNSGKPQIVISRIERHQ